MVFQKSLFKTEDVIVPLLEHATLTRPDLQVSTQCDAIVAFFNFFDLACLLVTHLVPVSAPKTSDLSSDGLLVSFERVLALAIKLYGVSKHVVDLLHVVEASFHGSKAFENMILFVPVDLPGIQCLVLRNQLIDFIIIASSTVDLPEVSKGVFSA